MSNADVTPSRIDRATVVAIALLAYAFTNLTHEGAGHGGACALVGGEPVALNAIYFECEKAGLGPAADRWVASGGTLVNLAFGGAVVIAYRALGRAASGKLRYFLWILATLSFLQATGYWLFSGLGAIGDWAEVTRGLAPAWAYRLGLTVVGAAGYVLTIGVSVRALHALVGAAGDASERARVSRDLTLWPYLAGGAMYLAAGALNPLSPLLVLISAAAASLGGTSAMAWMASLLRSDKRFPPPETPALAMTRSWPWIVAGAIATLVFVAVFGRTVKL